jgi:PKD repeat protein
MRDGGNLTFTNIVFDYEAPISAAVWAKPFLFENSSGITIRDSIFVGDTAQGVSEIEDGHSTGIGLVIRDSENILVENNELSGFHRGMTFGSSENVIVRENDISDIRSDGINFAEVNNVLVEDNYIHNFEKAEGSGDHSDMIQFWTNGTETPSSNITIRGNHLDVGEGDATQSIFMRNDLVDRGLAGEEMFYQNILIEDNVIINGHAHGITVGETNGLTIRNNSVLHKDGKAVDGVDATSEIPRINLAETSTNVTVTNNATSTISGISTASDWTVKFNAFVQDQSPLDPGYYEDVFIASTLTSDSPDDSFIALPGGMLDKLSAGANITLNGSEAGGLKAHFHATNESGSDWTFDARDMLQGAGDFPEGTVFEWALSDGTRSEGAVLEHQFTTPGIYNVSLTTRQPDGTTDTQNATVKIESPDVLSFTAADGFSTNLYGVTTDINVTTASEGLTLTDSGVAAKIEREYLTPLLETNNFEISLTMAGDTAGGYGEVFRLHQSFITEVDKDGELSMRLFPTEGEMVSLTTTGAGLNDASTHQVTISFVDGQVQAYVDGALLGAAAFEGTLRDSGNGALLFGNGWGADNFVGNISTFDVTVDATKFAPSSIPQSPSNLVIEQPQLTATTEISRAAPVPEAFQPLSEEKIAAIATTAEQFLSAERQVDGVSSLVRDPQEAPQDDEIKQFETLISGELEEFSDSDQLGFSVDFQRDTAGTDDARLVWKHLELGLEVVDDGIRVRAATADDGFKVFTANNLGLDDGQMHRATVMLDTEGDRLQVVVDDKIVLDIDDEDFDLDAVTQGREWNWHLGSPWHDPFEGSIGNFQISDRFEFLQEEHEAT